ncbi:hypothetical protein ACI01nite_24960 [Acetobacter cibinongensis]|uniref:Uncharacterized protein n=1 Tax=Acetobacter cibinongensis TaxID=146475 RepID=A0A0D6N7Y6_9PROT|nr:hypothetical protein [Acetobacter cibinongensis]GAN61611.1 hypothetical protein Abci_046_044 [Acetobacter cibinongensis]GBQ17594.1 hypothetical protein AA0482_1953 [Acetobacter cibinongensis NRIC 0482]GEL59894.1 hypothetical protein ACI01nite_24960 [Acetobacter cibinongensis]
MQQRAFMGSLSVSGATSYFSDTGFVDTQAGISYPPILSELPDVDRELDISLSGSGMTQSFGQLTLNLDVGVSDAFNVRNHTAQISLKIGLRTYDAARGWWSDPALSSCVPLFSGSATAWRVGDTQGTLTLAGPIELSRKLPLATYAGTGGIEGEASLAGRVKPRLRGFAYNFTPVCVDSVNQIYQISDAPLQTTSDGSPNLTVLEGGLPGSWNDTSTAGSWSYHGWVSDITAASPPAGHYTIESGKRGAFFRLGGTPVYEMTCTGSGAFPDYSSPHRLHDVVRQVLIQDVGIAANTLAPDWSDPFDQNGKAVVSDAGCFWDGSQSYTGSDMLAELLQGTMRKLTYDRDGTLRLIGITAAFLSQTVFKGAKNAVMPEEILTLRQADMPSELVLPLTCGRCTYAKNYTVLSGNQINPSAISSSLKTARSAVTVGTDSPTAEVVSPPDVLTSLQSADAAQVVAQAINDLWAKAERRLFYVTVPFHRLADFKIGSSMVLFAHVDGLRNGLPGLVVGESYRGSSDGEITFTVLV